MNGTQRAVIGMALGTGVIMARIPADLIIPFLGLELGTIAAAYSAYRGVPAVRDSLDDLAQRTQRLLGAGPGRRALPPPAEPAEMLARLLADGIRADLAAPAPRTGTTQLVLRAAPPDVVAAREKPDAPSAVLVTYHPELATAWAADPLNRSGLDAIGPLDASFDSSLIDLLRALDVVAARVAADSTIGPTHQAAMALLVHDTPLTGGQQRILNERCGWWRAFSSGRVRGTLCVLRAAAEVRERQPLTYADLDALDAPEEPLEEPLEGLTFDTTPAPVFPAHVPAVAPLAQRRPTGPAHPVARLSGSNAIPTVEITVGRAVNSDEWYYVPVKHGLIAKGTGGGKTNLLDLILGQLQGLGDAVDIWFGTAKPFVVIDPSDRLDRRPLIDRLPATRVARNPDDIMVWLWAATAEMHRRYKRMQDEPGWFPQPMVVIFDEVKAYFEVIDGQKVQQGAKQVDQSKLMASCLKQLLILSRECGGSLIFTSQDGYCGSLKLSRGELGNLGFRAVHPSLDPNSLSNVLPEGVPPMLRARTYDWLLATERGTELVAVPRVRREMFAAWGLIDAEPEAEEPAAPAVDDTALLRWALAEIQAGRPPTLTAAAAAFAVDITTMRAALIRNQMLDGGQG